MIKSNKNPFSSVQPNEYYRLKAEELCNSIMQVKTFIENHNLTIGLLAENILRDCLKEVLPKKVQVAHGFIFGNNTLSTQCDIIIYDCLNYSPFFAMGELVIVPSDAVIAVIEVKTSIKKETFAKTLDDFERLSSIGISQKFLFIYDGCAIKTLENYFFYSPNENDEKDSEELLTYSLPRYDYGNYEYLPEAIIALKQKYYLRKDCVITDSRDMVGYASLEMIDQTDKAVSCLQELIEKLSLLVFDYEFQRNKSVIPPLDNINNPDEDTIKRFNKYEGIALFDM